jgi:periplasmic copper chaperone A
VRRTRIGAAAAAVPLVLLILLATAGAASAHVTVSATTTAPGADTTLTFSVPTESDTASTTQVAIYFPTSQPFADADVQPKAGWSAKVITRHLTTPIQSDDGSVSQAVASITWTADSRTDAIHPGQFDTFSVAAGPLPESGSLEFKALQTYSDGSVVRWIDDTVPGEPEPDHPAPTLTVTATPAAAGDGSSGSGRTPLILSIVALLVAVGGAAVSVYSVSSVSSVSSSRDSSARRRS